MPLGASSQPLRGYRPTTGSSELRSHPPARLLSCGAAAAPRSPGEAAGGHFLPRRPRAPRRSRSPAERPPPRDLPRRCPPRETARSVLPPLGCAKLKAMKQRKGQKQRTAAPRTRDGMGGRPDGGHGPASPSAPRRGAAAAGGAPGPYPAPHSRRSGRSRWPSAAPAAASCCGRGPSPPPGAELCGWSPAGGSAPARERRNSLGAASRGGAAPAPHRESVTGGLRVPVGNRGELRAALLQHF